MKGMNQRILMILLLAANAVHAAAERTYSNVEYIEESGDRVGVEVRITISDDGSVTGTVFDYQGADALPVDVAGRLDGEALTLAGSMDDARVTIEAKITPVRLVGILRYHLSRQTNEFPIDLPRVSRPRHPKD